jgi:hypothetical protein
MDARRIAAWSWIFFGFFGCVRKDPKPPEPAGIEARASELMPLVRDRHWIRAQDLGAIAPQRMLEDVRIWRKEIGADLFGTMGLPREDGTIRPVTVGEIRGQTKNEEDTWWARALSNLRIQTRTATPTVIQDDSGKVLVCEWPDVPFVSALIADSTFRQQMLTRFHQDKVGVFVPARDHLILYDLTDFVSVKPAQMKSKMVYDRGVHPVRFEPLVLSREGLAGVEGS